MDHHQVVFCMVHGVDDLLGRQAYVHRMQHGANHRDGKEAFQVPGRIPVHHSNGIAPFDTRVGEGVGQSVDTFNQVGIGVLAAVGVDDFLVGRVPGAGKKQLFDQQWVLVSVVCRLQDAGLCHGSVPLSIV
nr:hypothetical protein [Marinobacter sp. DS40M8]